MNNEGCTSTAMTVSSTSINSGLLYKRLGHLAIHALTCVLKTCNLSADINKIHKISFCDARQCGKSHL